MRHHSFKKRPFYYYVTTLQLATKKNPNRQAKATFMKKNTSFQAKWWREWCEYTSFDMADDSSLKGTKLDLKDENSSKCRKSFESIIQEAVADEMMNPEESLACEQILSEKQKMEKVRKEMLRARMMSFSENKNTYYNRP